MTMTAVVVIVFLAIISPISLEFAIFAIHLLEFSMCRYIITLVLSFWLVHLFGDNPVQDTSLVLERVCFPVVEAPACFRSNIDGKDFLVFIEYSDSLSIKGHYMTMEETMTDTLPFRLEAQDYDAVLYYEDGQKTFLPHVISIDSQYAEGYTQSDVCDSALFCFEKHQIPVFKDLGNSRYREAKFAVEKIKNIPYAKAEGFWSELADETEVSDKIFKMGNAIVETPLKLHLDVFRPKNDTLKKRPLVMLVHGGAFYFGSKDDKAIARWCRHLASKGYVTASINYRIGFLPTMASIGRAGYRAVQDAHAAMRFLVANQEKYGIDTSMIFVGGTSAGAITALNLAFMTNESRPEYTHSGFLKPDLGDIGNCGNNIKADFRIKGIVDMWGAMPDTALMRGHNIPIIAFHGDADDIVPYDYNYPFATAGGLKTLLVEKMYGSSCIVDRAKKLGNKAQLITFSGYKHSPHVNPETKALNENFYLIQNKMSNFFYEIIMPEEIEIVEKGSSYSLNVQPIATSWLVEGGIILNETKNHVEVQWIKNAPIRSITASATLPYGLGIKTTKTIK